MSRCFACAEALHGTSHELNEETRKLLVLAFQETLVWRERGSSVAAGAQISHTFRFHSLHSALLLFFECDTSASFWKLRTCLRPRIHGYHGFEGRRTLRQGTCWSCSPQGRPNAAPRRLPGCRPDERTAALRAGERRVDASVRGPGRPGLAGRGRFLLSLRSGDSWPRRKKRKTQDAQSPHNLGPSAGSSAQSEKTSLPARSCDACLSAVPAEHPAPWNPLL